MKGLAKVIILTISMTFLANCGGSQPTPIPPSDTYNLTFEGTECSVNGDSFFTEEIIRNRKDVLYTIKPKFGFDLPSQISVTEGVKYAYNPANGLVDIYEMTQDVKITVTATLNANYRLFSFTGTNCSILDSNPHVEAIHVGDKNVKRTISPDAGFTYPSTIDPIGGNVSYDSQYGVITIAEMTENVTLTATADPTPAIYGINFVGMNCTASLGGTGTPEEIFHTEKASGTELTYLIAPKTNCKLLGDISFKINNLPSRNYEYNPEIGETGNYVLTFVVSGEISIAIDAVGVDKVHTITFDSNGGSPVPKLTISEGSKATAPIPPTKEKYSFEGWYYDDDTFEKQFNFLTTAVFKDIELHAKWKSTDITITFDAGLYGCCELGEERTYVIPIQPNTKWGDIDKHITTFGCARDGYDFMYWTLDGKKMLDDTFIDESIKLDAVYRKTSSQYLTFIPRTENATLTITRDINNFQYMKEGDPDGFTDVEDYSVSVTVNIGTRIYVKGNNASIGSPTFNSDASSYFAVTGPIKSVINGASTLTENFVFYRLFEGFDNLTSAGQLQLSFNGLARSCYQDMFLSCENLLVAPKLPATTLAYACYRGMFWSCHSLKVPPSILPATNAVEQCYIAMFEECSALSCAPQISASTFEKDSCKLMFADCESLKVSKDSGEHKFVTFPSDIDTTYCSINMFKNIIEGDTPEAGKSYYWNYL